MLVGDSLSDMKERIVIGIIGNKNALAVVGSSFMPSEIEQFKEYTGDYETTLYPYWEEITKRLMTNEEIRGWAYNEGSSGWVVCFENDDYKHPCSFSYNARPVDYRRAKISPEGEIGKWEKFYVKC